MFKTSIGSTPLTTEAADSFFHNITGERFGNDNSFLATLRALVAPRIKDGEFIHLSFGSSDYNSSAIGSVPAERVVSAICSDHSLSSPGGIMIHSFTSNQESNIANFTLIENRFTSCFQGYNRLEKVREFYRKSFYVDCYINPELKSVIVFVDNLDNKKLHYLQVSILAFLPWYFDPKDGVSDLEMELIYSLRESSSAKYETCLAKIAENYDFRTFRIRQLLKGFETRYEQLECENVRREIQKFDSDISRLNDQIGSLLNKRNEVCIRLLGLERKIAEGGDDSEIMEYFLCNNRLVLESVTERDMYFCVKDYISYFDSEMAERTINNPRSFVYLNGRDSYRGITSEGMKKLMWEIFVEEEPRLRIKVCAAYRFGLNGNVSPMGGHTFSYEFAEYMPNPHIDRYNCMGNYQQTINRILQSRNYIGALEQCIASCKSLNWGDSTVMQEFMRTMWGAGDYSNRCIELPDGSVVKPAEAIRWLEEQEAGANEQEQEEA